MVCKSLLKKRFVATALLGVANDGVAATVVCSGPSRATVPTNQTLGAAGDTVGAASDTSRPYKWVDL
jgi:hypothetical protein